MKGLYSGRIKELILFGFKEDGGAVLDGVLALAVVLIIVLILVHFGFTLSSVITSLKKFIGVID